MKTIRTTGIILTAGVLFTSAVHTFAIEGLKISVRSSNVVLSWPSASNETYIVQYRQTLNSTDTWVTLTNYFPAAIGTNLTYFVHSNIVQYSFSSSGDDMNGGGGVSPSEPEMMNGSGTASDSTATVTPPAMPMAMPADGSGDAVPLALYPPGIDLSRFIIFDPATGEWVRGAGYSVSFANGAKAGNFQPLDDSSGGGNSVSDPGFYRVVRDGVHIYDLTNGMVLSGEGQFPIEFAVDSTDQIVGVTFYDENNSPIIGASAQGAGNHWTLDWNTSMSFNGDYNIYAELDFASDDSVTSAPVTVTINNTISFPNYFSRVFGDQMWIFAQTIPDAAYEIDMYDENTNYLGSFFDYADDGGYISFLWDLTDGNGYTFDSTNFFGVFTVDTSSLSSLSKTQMKNLNANSPGFQALSLSKRTFGSKIKANGVSPNDGSSSSARANQLWVKEPGWSPGNSWAIAYSPLTVNDPATTYKISEMMIGGDGGEYGGVVSTLGYYGMGAPMSPGNVSQSSAFEMADTNSRTQFLSYLAQSQYRHCYFFGHGSPSAFGTKGAVITSYDLMLALVNVPLSYQIQHAALHPYRLVFIDGCSVGAGNLCESFGIPAQTLNNQFFANTHVQSRAFLGFKTTTSFDPSQWTWRALMLGGFFEDWMGNAPLQTCVNNAVNGVHSSGYQPLPSSWVIYGATDLQRGTDTTQ